MNLGWIGVDRNNLDIASRNVSSSQSEVVHVGMSCFPRCWRKDEVKISQRGKVHTPADDDKENYITLNGEN